MFPSILSYGCILLVESFHICAVFLIVVSLCAFHLNLPDVPRMVIYGMKDRLMPRKNNRKLASDVGNSDEANHFIYEGKQQEDLQCVNRVNI